MDCFIRIGFDSLDNLIVGLLSLNESSLLNVKSLQIYQMHHMGGEALFYWRLQLNECKGLA